MKKNLLFLILVIYGGLFSIAQPVNDDWFEVGNSAYNSELQSIAFRTQDTGFAVGTGGAFLKTTDGGNTWTAINIGFNYFFKKIVFTNSKTGYICGGALNNSEGRMLKTIDGGNTWQEVFSYNHYLHDVFFLNDTVGYAATYGRIYRTKNGGVTWNFAQPQNCYDVFSVWFRTVDTGFVAANGKVWMTVDSGNVWVDILPNNWTQIMFTSNSNGYLVRTGTLYRTIDKGLNWTQSSNTGISFIQGFNFINDSSGLIWSTLDQPGIIKRTTDYGNSWTTVMNDQSNPVMNISVRKTDNTYFACGRGGLIMKSTNGSNWTILHRGNIPNQINRLCFINDSTIFAVGNGGLLLKSTNKASSWTNINSGTSEDLKAICKITSDTLMVLTQSGKILKSVNAGNSWQLINTGITSSVNRKGDIYFLNNKTGLIAMENIYRTNNGGATWTQVYSYLPVFELAVPSLDTLYAAAWQRILISIDSGNSWSIAQSNSSIFWGIHSRNTRHVMAAYQNYKVYITTNGGSSWSNTTLSGVQLEDVRYLNDTSAYVVGWNGNLYKSINNGSSWTQINSGTMRHFYEVYFGPDGTGYILGQDGMILRRLLTPTYFLKFDITDDDGNAVANATLTLNSASYPAGVDSVGGLSATTYQYVISKAGYLPDTATIQLTTDSVIHVILKKFRTVSFNITNIYAHPVDAAQVSLGAYNPETSNSAGLAIFEEVVKANALSLDITAIGYLPYNATLNIQGDSTFYILLQADLNAPLALPATNIGDLTFTANWQNVAAADSFKLFVSSDNFISHLAGYNGKLIFGTSEIIAGLQAGASYQYRLKSVNDYGQSDFSNTVLVTTLTSMAENPENRILLYPNPVSDYLIIESDEPIIQTKIFNSLGSEILLTPSFYQDNKIILYLSGLKNGVYIFYLKTNCSLINKKIIINK